MNIANFVKSLFQKDAPIPEVSDPLTPPRKLIDGVGGGDYHAVGREFFGYFTGIGGLQPQHRVLDVGCGCGRMAVPLIDYLSGPGEYWGFDIVPEAVRWSREHIGANHQRFHFELADIFNTAYNRKGKSSPSNYRFPYADDFFDFTFLTSVFTHMLTPEMQHYLSEIARTLKPGGRCLISCFLLNPESRPLMEGGISKLKFSHPLPDCFVEDLKTPESAVAFEESFFRQCFARQNLHIIEPVHYGSWAGRKQFMSFQDIVVATKR